MIFVCNNIKCYFLNQLTYFLFFFSLVAQRMVERTAAARPGSRTVWKLSPGPVKTRTWRSDGLTWTEHLELRGEISAGAVRLSNSVRAARSGRDVQQICSADEPSHPQPSLSIRLSYPARATLPRPRHSVSILWQDGSRPINSGLAMTLLRIETTCHIVNLHL